MLKTPVLFILFAVLIHGTLTAETPQKVLIIGDSMMVLPAHATQLALKRMDGVEARSEPSIGSGLARLDALDWMQKARDLVEEFNPDLTMVWFGTNDYQPMQTPDGLVRPEDDSWMKEYSRRMVEMMDILAHNGNAKVYWLEIPVMREDSLTGYVKQVNAVAKAEADKRENVVFFPTNSLLTRKPDAFTAFLIDNKGRPLKIRESDGIHLTRAGADLVSDAFIKAVFR